MDLEYVCFLIEPFRKMMMVRGCCWWLACLMLILCGAGRSVEASPRRLLVDTDVDSDDFFAILYLLKLEKSEFDLQVFCIYCLGVQIHH